MSEENDGTIRLPVTAEARMVLEHMMRSVLDKVKTINKVVG
jgi:hypothetical protein